MWAQRLEKPKKECWKTKEKEESCCLGEAAGEAASLPIYAGVCFGQIGVSARIAGHMSYVAALQLPPPGL